MTVGEQGLLPVPAIPLKEAEADGHLVPDPGEHGDVELRLLVELSGLHHRVHAVVSHVHLHVGGVHDGFGIEI